MACSDILGLGELKFEEPAAPEPPPESTASGGNQATSTTSAHDDPGPKAEEEDSSVGVVSDSFPSTWSTSTLFAVEPMVVQNPYYFGYEPERHELSILRLTEGDDRIATATWASDVTWTHLAVVHSEDGPVLIGYESATGIVERASGFDDSGDFRVERSAGNQHTHLMVFPWQSQQVLFGYDARTGFYRGIPGTDADRVQVFQGYVEVGWSAVVAMQLDERAGLMFHDAASGRYAFYRLEESGSDLDRSVEGEVVTERGIFAWSETGGSHFALYERSGGLTQWVRLGETSGYGGDGPSPLLIEDFSWYLRRGLTWMTTLDLQAGQAVLSFDGHVLDLNFPFTGEGENIVR